MTGPDECVGIDLNDNRGCIRVFADGHVELDQPALHVGDLVTENTPPPAPIGGVLWNKTTAGYYVWCKDGSVYPFPN